MNQTFTLPEVMAGQQQGKIYRMKSVQVGPVTVNADGDTYRTDFISLRNGVTMGVLTGGPEVVVTVDTVIDTAVTA